MELQVNFRGGSIGNEKPGDKASYNADRLTPAHAGNTLRLAHQLEELTGLESRLSILPENCPYFSGEAGLVACLPAKMG